MWVCQEARKVIITSHSDDMPMNVVGVNQENYDPLFDDVVSTTSRLTNCIAPLAKVIVVLFGCTKSKKKKIKTKSYDSKSLYR